MTILGENLKKAREKSNLSQETVSKLLKEKYGLKINRVTISKWETSSQLPKIDNLQCLAEIYNITIDELSLNNKILKEQVIKNICDANLNTAQLQILNNIINSWI